MNNTITRRNFKLISGTNKVVCTHIVRPEQCLRTHAVPLSYDTDGIPALDSIGDNIQPRAAFWYKRLGRSPLNQQVSFGNRLNGFRFGKYPEKSIKQMTAEVIDNLLADCPVQKKDIEAAWFSNSFWGIVTGQHSLRGQVALVPLGIEGIPTMNVENACAGATSAVNGAYLGIRAGAYDVALAIGVEKMFNPDNKQAMFEMFMSNADVEFIRVVLAAFMEDEKKKAAEAEATGGGKKGGGEGARSPFMDLYAAAARMHMEKYGTKEEQFALISVGAISLDRHHFGAHIKLCTKNVYLFHAILDFAS